MLSTCNTWPLFDEMRVRASKFFATQPRTFINSEVNEEQVHAGAGTIIAALAPGIHLQK